MGGWVTLCQAEILREWNELSDAQALATEAISLVNKPFRSYRSFFLPGVRRAGTCLPLIWKFGGGMHFPPAG